MSKSGRRNLSLLLTLLMVVQLLFSPATALAVTTEAGTMLPPSNLAVQMLTPDDIKLTWSSVFGATGYNIYGIIDGQLVLLGTTKNAYYTFNDLAEGSYRYVVSTLNSIEESGPCAPVDIDIVYPKMTIPQSLNYTVQNGNDIALSWTAVQYAEGYNIFAIKGDGQPELVATATAANYKLLNMPAGNYEYAVSAVNSKYGESPLSAPVQVEIVHPVMAAPVTFTATVANVNDVTLKWGAVSYATGYNIYEITGTGKTLKGTLTGTTVTYTKLPPGNYLYEIRSFSDRFGESAEGRQAAFAIEAVELYPPTNLNYNVQNGNDIVLSWEGAANATSYKIYQVVDGQKTLKSTVTGKSVTYANMPAGNYSYQVYSYSDRFGESTESANLSFELEPILMSPPVTVTYKIQNLNDVVLTWEACAYANSYKVYQIIDGQRILKSTVTGTTVTYTKLPAGEYTYEVRSFSTRFGESTVGTAVVLEVGSVDISPPQNLTKTIANGNDIVLAWDPVENADSYKIYQVVDGQKILRSTVTAAKVTYTNRPEGEYTYEVHSYSARFGQSAESSQINFTLVHPEMEPPTNLTFKTLSATQFSLSWEPALYATGYKVYQLVNGQKVLKSTVTATTVTYSNMAPGDYTFEVHAISSRFGESIEGTTLTMTLNGQVMEEPVNPSYTITNGNDVTLKWTGVPYATSYKIYQVVDGQKVLKSTVSTLNVKYSNIPEGDYTFFIHSYSTLLGESPNGSEIKFALVFPEMEAPASLTHTIKNGNDIVLAWTSVPYATNYKVYELVEGEKVLKATVTGLTTTMVKVTNGNHTYIVHSVSSRFGESPAGVSLSLNLEWITMLPPTNLTYSITNGNDVTLRWTASAYANSYNVYRIADGEKVLLKTVTTVSAALINMPSGDYTFEVNSVSTRFGESEEGAQITLTLEQVVMVPPSNPTYTVTSGNDITLRWTASTYANNYRIYQVINGEKTLVSTVTGSSVIYRDMPAGEYKYLIHSYSTRFGESPLASELMFDLVWPVVEPPLLKGEVFNANNITLSWHTVPWANEYRLYEVSDGERQLLYKGTALSYKVYNLSEDTHYYEVTAYSTRFGESVPSNRLVEDIIYPIMQPPSAKLTLLSQTSARITWDFVVYANGYNIYEVIDGEPVLLVKNLNNLSYTLYDLTYRDHEYYVTSYSNSFGESEPSDIVLAKLIVDTDAPVTTADAPLDWVNKSPVTVNLTATDNETGVANTYYALKDGEYVTGTSLNVDEEGISKISYYSVDKVGNVEAPRVAYVKLDLTAPVTVVNDIPAWSREPVTLTFTATDALSGVAKTLYSLNNGAYQEGTELTIAEEGQHKVTFYSVDAAGNVEGEKTLVVNVDGTAPVTTATEVPDWSNTPVEVVLKVADGLSGVDSTWYSLDGAAYIEGSNITVGEEGIHNVDYYSTDLAGNKETVKSFDVKIDKTPPIVTMELQNEYELGATITMTYVATDNLSGVATETLTIFEPNSTTGKPVENGTSLVLDKPGMYRVVVRVTDVSGLTTTLERQYLVVIPATIEVTPKVLKGNKGIFTVRVELPDGFNQTIDLDTATLNGVNALTSNKGYYQQAKLGQFKFERADFNWVPAETLVVFRGYVGGNLVVGQTTVKVQK